MKHQLYSKKPLKNGEFYIINLGNKNSSGTHWTVLLRKRNVLKYFDSYGLPFGKTVTDYIKKHNNCSIQYNTHRFQENPESTSSEKDKTSICGCFAVDFIDGEFC